MAWTVLVDRRAAKDLAGAPEHVRARFGNAVDRLREDPLRARPGLDVKALSGASMHRLRIGAWRVLFEVDEMKKTVRVTTAAPRERAYG